MLMTLASRAPRKTPDKVFDRRGALLFSALGFCKGSAVLSMYAALGRGPVTIVSPLVATYPLVTVLLSSVFLKRERVDAPLIAAVTATVGGVALLFVTQSGTTLLRIVIPL